jgi:tRNA threonylcarbamoyladenosine biosynthesis protein TsaB
MRVLAFETSTDACSVALALGDEVAEEHEVAPRRHAELVLAMADRLLARAGLAPRDLDALAFGRGPGSFTGLRIAAGVVQGVAFAADLPVAPVSSLRALAQGAWRERGARGVVVAVDARIGEVYWGAYRLGVDARMEVIVDDRLGRPDTVAMPAEAGLDWLGAGSAWAVHGQALGSALEGVVREREPGRLPHALDVVTLALPLLRAGQGVSAERALPVYLRERVTQV